MSNNLRLVKGCKDILFDQALQLRHIVEVARKQALLYLCSEIFTPVIEHTDVFVRSLGDFSDIVHKEMYSFVDKSERELTLRPEFTAGIMRAILSNSLQHKCPLRFFSWGPVFRRENPQAGRQRQFHQINVEFIGSADYLSDVEIIKLADDILQKLTIQNYVLEINSLGCSLSRQNYQKALIDYFNDHKSNLSEISKIRLQTNPLRILDSKEQSDMQLISNAPNLQDYYTSDAADYFEKVLENLRLLNVKYKVNPRIVRGLDYYSHTVFEFISQDLGAQSTLMAGGRYDGLAELMGDKTIPAVGFAGGVERLMMVCQSKPRKLVSTIVIPISEKEKMEALKVVYNLRQNNIACKLEMGNKIGDVIQKAISKYDPEYTILIGENEIQQGKYMFKDLKHFSQKLLTLNEITEFLTSTYE